MQQGRIVVVGSLHSDFTFSGPRMPVPGETVEGSRFHAAPGGRGGNQAVAAARLGAQVAMVARVGADPRGATLLQALAAEGVDTGCVSADAERETGVAGILVGADGEKRIMTFPGANAALAPDRATGCAAVAALLTRDVLLVQLEIPLATVAAVVGVAYTRGARVVLDAGPAHHELRLGLPFAEALLPRVTLLCANQLEAEALTGMAVNDRGSASVAAAALLARGCGAALISTGDGELLLDERGELWTPRVGPRRVDATGAGDALCGGIAACLADGGALRDAVARGLVVSSLAASRWGGQTAFPTLKEVEAAMAGAPVAEPA